MQLTTLDQHPCDLRTIATGDRIIDQVAFHAPANCGASILSARLVAVFFAIMAFVPLSASLAAPLTAAQLLANRGLANAYYACLLNGIAQHLPLKQIQDDCAILFTFNGEKPGGPSTNMSPFGHPSSALDPATLSAICATADSGRAANPLGSGSITAKTPWGQVFPEGYTYGGKGQTDGYVTDEHGNVGVAVYKGLSETDARKQKQKAIDEYEKAVEEGKKLVDKQTDDLKDHGKEASDWKNDPKMKKDRDAADEKVKDAAEKMNKDPNVGFGGIVRTASSSDCEMALQEAREFVVECQRTEWRSGDCKRFLARFEGCPDPTLIYVDPEIGYTCRPKIDPQALRQAAVNHCHQLVRPTVDGPDPCMPPQVDGSARYVSGTPNSPCGGPQVLTTGDAPCVHAVILRPFGERSMQNIYLWGLNLLGGPIVVFGPRDTDPRPGPGPSPRPGPDGGNPFP
jgi:hypothetical protein